MKERIIQFGGGNFLRGFADDFIDSLNKQGFLTALLSLCSQLHPKQAR